MSPTDYCASKTAGLGVPVSACPSFILELNMLNVGSGAWQMRPLDGSPA